MIQKPPPNMKYTGSWSARAMHKLVLQESFKFGFTVPLQDTTSGCFIEGWWHSSSSKFIHSHHSWPLLTFKGLWRKRKKWMCCGGGGGGGGEQLWLSEDWPPAEKVSWEGGCTVSWGRAFQSFTIWGKMENCLRSVRQVSRPCCILFLIWWLEALDRRSVDDLVEHGQTCHTSMFKDRPVQSSNHVINTCCVSKRTKWAAPSLLWTISILEVSFVWDPRQCWHTPWEASQVTESESARNETIIKVYNDRHLIIIVWPLCSEPLLALNTFWGIEKIRPWLTVFVSVFKRKWKLWN